jgi:hypothetical protein
MSLQKVAQAQPIFDKINTQLLPWKKRSRRFCAASAFKKNCPKKRTTQKGENSSKICLKSVSDFVYGKPPRVATRETDYVTRYAKAFR